MNALIAKANPELLEKISRVLLYSFAFLLPIWFLPWGGVGIAREAFFSILILAVFGIALLRVLSTSEIWYVKSPVNVAVLVFVAITGISALLSKTPYFALVGSDVLAERFMSVLAYGLLYFLVVHIFRDKKDPILFAFLMIGGGALFALISLLQFFGVHPLSFVFPTAIDLNFVGTLNSLAFFYGFLLIALTGFILSTRDKVHVLPRLLRVGIWVSFVLFFLNLVIINFVTVWASFIIAMMFLSWSYMRNQELQGDFKNFYFYLLLALLIIPFLFILIRVPLFSSIPVPSEVSVSMPATLDIAKKTLSSDITTLFFGSGPGTFVYSYNMYKDAAINLTDFWGVRFGQGNSYVTTVASTTGILGVLATLGLIILSIFTIIKNMLRAPSAFTAHPLLPGFFGGIVFLFLSLFLYPGNYTLFMVLFSSLGIAVALSRPSEGGDRWGGERRIEWKSPWSIFASSLLAVFLLGLTVVGMYFGEERYRAAVLLDRAVLGLQTNGDIDSAVTKLESASRADFTNDRYQRFLAQGYLLKIQSIIEAAFRENPPANIQTDFQNEVGKAIAALQRSVQLNELEPFNWRTAGAVYETLIPFVPGADQSALGAYARAAQVDGMSPLPFVDMGRTYMVVADAAETLASQTGTTAARVKELNQARADSLGFAADVLKKATNMKQDLASAHFLLAQVSLRRGETAEAISNTEKARTSAPQDIGILFQLGLLYYQNNQLTKGQEVFIQALALNENYSNARYFLGLILDRKGQKEDALKEFEKIAVLNPDNQEIKKIISNLKGNKAALTGITPPAPEDRKKVPVEEKAGDEKTPIKK